MQEAKDKNSLTVATYTIEQQKIAKEHLATAIELLAATDDRQLVQELKPLSTALPE